MLERSALVLTKLALNRPAIARVQQARPQSARMHRPAAGIAQCEDDRGAEQLKAMAKQVDYVTASVIPPDSGTWM